VEVVQHDVVVVGSGCAGLRAALAASSAAQLSVACITKDPGLNAGAVGSGGGASAPLDPEDVDLFAYETVIGGDFLADQAVVEALATEVPAELRYVARLGCPWTRNADGEPCVRRFGGMSRPRAWFVRDRTGAQVRRALFHAALAEPAIRWLNEYVVTKLLIEDGQICGVAAMNLRTGQLKAILARAVVMATGGASQLFASGTGGAGDTGDGVALAYRAGAVLSDVEFVQFHPTGLVPSGLVVTEALRADGGHLRNSEQVRFLQDAASGVSGELARRDQVCRAMQAEIFAQRAFSTPQGPALLLDLRELDSSLLADQMPGFCELADRFGTGRQPRVAVHVRPAAHGLSGGIASGVEGRTSLPGLFAAGDVASGVHGATALGGNALSSSLVQGRRAGHSAAKYAVGVDPKRSAVIVDQATAEAARLERLRTRRPEENAQAIRQDLQSCMERDCGLFRDARGLKTCLREIGQLKERYTHAGVVDRSTVFNQELARTLELRNLLDVAEVVVTSALLRTESRGTHYRSDYRERDDARFLKNSHVQHQTSGPDVSFVPVRLKRWSPEAPRR